MNAVRKQASTTKIMTAILLIESGKLNKKTKISKKVAETPYGNLNMKKGDVYRNSDLLKAMLVASSNESAAAVAVTVGGTQKKFVKKMNAKARKLGLKDTVFENPSGLDGKKNHSTAYDLVRMIAYASQYDEFMDAIGTSKYTFKTVKKKEKKTVKTTDTELKSYSKRHLGGKTGYTSKAGCCFASVYKYKGKHYAVAILGCKDDGSRWKDMKKLYKYIDSYSYKKY
jgi:D-alanyl-D-alanine carboxypeptidase